MSVFDNSRYLRTEQVTRLGWNSPLLKMRKRFTFNEENCQVHEWVSSDTLDGVSYKYYGETAFRWAILDANPKYRTEFDIKSGDRILIPDYEEVVDLVNV